VGLPLQIGFICLLVRNSPADLKALGGLDPLVEALGATNASLRASAAYVLGTAASNNAKFQHTLLAGHPDIFVKLMEVCVQQARVACLCVCLQHYICRSVETI
jgi:hypothetical protein